MTIFKSIRNFFTGHKLSYDYDSETSYSHQAFRSFLHKFNKWGWLYRKWRVDFEADQKYTMEFIDNLGNYNIFSSNSIAQLNHQFNIHAKLIVKQPYKQTNQIKRFGKGKG